MPKLTNPTDGAFNVPGFDFSIAAGASIEVSDEVAAAFAGHPVLVISADAAPVVEPAPVAVEPEPAPVVEVHIPTPVELAEAEVARASADLQAAQAASEAAPAADTEGSK